MVTDLVSQMDPEGKKYNVLRINHIHGTDIQHYRSKNNLCNDQSGYGREEWVQARQGIPSML